jgi:chemotaxis protein MotB
MAKGRKQIEESSGVDDSWLGSYADLITNFLSVFVILFSFAMVNHASAVYKTMHAEDDTDSTNQVIQEGELTETHNADTYLDEATSLPTPEATLSANDSITLLPTVSAMATQGINPLYEAIREYIETTGLTGQLSVVQQSDQMILLRADSSILFDLGSADISPAADTILESVCDILVKYQDEIRMLSIEGHTDNLPISTTQFDSNWELSTSRAVNVLRRVLDLSAIDPSKFSAVGLGEFHPIADNTTEEGRAQNRRVDFIIETKDDE